MFVHLQKQPGPGVSQIFAAILKMIFLWRLQSFCWIDLEGPWSASKAVPQFCRNAPGWGSQQVCMEHEGGCRISILHPVQETLCQELLDQDGEEILTSSMHKAQALKFASNQDVKSSIARLQRKKLEYTPKALKRLGAGLWLCLPQKVFASRPRLATCFEPSQQLCA